MLDYTKGDISNTVIFVLSHMKYILKSITGYIPNMPILLFFEQKNYGF